MESNEIDRNAIAQKKSRPTTFIQRKLKQGNKPHKGKEKFQYESGETARLVFIIRGHRHKKVKVFVKIMKKMAQKNIARNVSSLKYLRKIENTDRSWYLDTRYSAWKFSDD